MWLRVCSGPDAGTDVHLPEGTPFVLGRQEGVDLVVRDPLASRRHLELTATSHGHVLARDLGSSNGTTLDAAPLSQAELSGGEELRIGTVVMRVSRDDPAVTVAAPSAAPVGALATPSMVMRIVERSTRSTRRTVMLVSGLLAVAVAVLAGVLFTRGGDAEAQLPRVLARARAATMPITIHGAGGQTGLGTGWRAAGLGTVTAAHVVNAGPTLSVPAGPARVLGVAPCDDLALLSTPAGGQAMTLASGQAREGEGVAAVGFQPGSSATVTNRGVVSATGVSAAPAPDVPAYSDVLQTDTALNPGLSGGPLLDLSGHVVGVDVATRSTSDDGRALQGVNYAVPIGRAKALLRQMRAGRSPSWTGLTFAFPTAGELKAAHLPAGLRITGAVPGTPAARAHITPGTLLAGVDGQPIDTTLASLCGRLRGRATGDQVVLNLATPGATVTRQLRLRLA